MRRIFVVFSLVSFLIFNALSQNLNFRYQFSSDVQFLGFDKQSDALFLFDWDLKEFLLKDNKLYFVKSFNPFASGRKLLFSVSPSRDLIALAQYGSDVIKIYRFSKDLQLVDSLRTEAEIEQLAIAGDYVLVGGLFQDTKAIQLYDLKTKRVLAGDLFGDTQEFERMIVSNNGQYVAFVVKDALTRRFTLNFYHYNNGVFDNQMSLTTSKPVRDIAFISSKGDELLAIVGKDLIKFNDRLAQNEVIRMGRIYRLSVGESYSKVYVSGKRYLSILQLYPNLKLDTVVNVRNSFAAYSENRQLWAVLGDNFLRLARLDTSFNVIDSLILPVKKVHFKALSSELLVFKHKKWLYATSLKNLRLLNKSQVKAQRFFALDQDKVLFTQGSLLKIWRLSDNSFWVLDTLQSRKNLLIARNGDEFAVVQPRSIKIYRISERKVKEIQSFTNVKFKKIVGAELYPTQLVAMSKNGHLTTFFFIKNISKGVQLSLPKNKVLAFSGDQVIARSKDTLKFIKIGKSYEQQTGSLLLKGIKKAYLNHNGTIAVLVRPQLFGAKVFIYQLPELKQIFSHKVKKYLFSNDKKSLIIHYKDKKVDKTVLIDLD